MSIPIAKLKRQIQQRIRGSGEDFDYTFYAAINDVVQDLIVKTIIEVEAIDEDDPPDEIDLDLKYYRVFLEGIAYYMQKGPNWARSSEEVSIVEYERALAVAQMEAIEDEESAIGLDYEDDDA